MAFMVILGFMFFFREPGSMPAGQTETTTMGDSYDTPH